MASSTPMSGEWSVTKTVAAVETVLVLLFMLFSFFQLVTWLPANQIMVMQSVRTGALTVHTEPGPYLRLFATITKYPKLSQVWFSSRKDQGNKIDEGLPIIFNDNGKATMSLGISWEMPGDYKHVIGLHTRYNNAESIAKQLIEPVIQKAVFALGPLMSSQESVAVRRNDLFQYLEDQVQNGVFKTQTVQELQKDAITGLDKPVAVVRLVLSKDGTIARADDSPLREFGVHVLNPVINQIDYEKKVQDQIASQQTLIMQVQTSIAEAKQAEQKAITAEKNGQAAAAEAKWKQLAIMAQQVTEAEQRRNVAALDAEAAGHTKRKLILEGEGEAGKRQLVMSADGALDKKLEAYVATQKMWSEAFGRFQGAVVPSVVTGGGGSSGNAAVNFMELMGVKAAKDLAVDMHAVGAAQTGKQVPK